MKKNITFLALMLAAITTNAQTAVDFTANDCNSTSHHLFADLDAGKVVVITFVMPCSMCISPSQTAYSTVQSYATSNPGKVVFYLATNAGSPACATLTNWASTNSLSAVPCFADASVRETDYGSVAMPKTVALAGTNHHVIYSEDNGLNNTNLKNAIDLALTPTSVGQTQKGKTELSVYPNPAQSKLYVSYSLDKQTDVSIDIINITGAKVKTITVTDNSIGQHLTTIDIAKEGLSNGVYFVQLNAGQNSQRLKFTISK